MVIVSIISVFGMLITNKIIGRSNYNNLSSEDIWEQEFKRVEENRVGIVFNAVTTTEDEYNILRAECNNYIENSEDNIDLDANIDVDITVNEDTFVDKNNNGQLYIFDIPKRLESKRDNNDKQYGMVETGPIYFDGLLMIRYINDFGELKIVCSAFNDDTNTKAISFNQSDITEYYKIATIPDQEENEELKSKQIPESEYISIISECIKNLILSKNMQDERAAISKSVSYFTLDGKNTVLKSRESFDITDDTKIELVNSIAGKSDTSKTIKDRIYLQYKITNGSEINYTNIIVKLNSNLRIFDIDII